MWAAAEIGDGGRRRIDAQVMVQRGKDFLKDTGRSTASPPMRSVAPMIWPVRMPPPARIAQDTLGQ